MNNSTNHIKPRQFGLVVCLALLAIVESTCISGCGERISALPAEPPSDLTITYRWSSGRGVSGRSLTVRRGESVYEKRYIRTVSNVTFTSSDDELRNLYQALQKNKFDLIALDDHMILDAGEESVTVIANGITYSKSQGAVHGINEKWRTEWRAVTSAVNNLVEGVEKKHQVACRILIDEALGKEKFRFELDGVTVASHDPGQSAPLATRVDVMTLPGEHHFYLCIENCERYARKNLPTKAGSFISVGLRDEKLFIEENK